jgi:hypothetical protein
MERDNAGSVSLSTRRWTVSWNLESIIRYFVFGVAAFLAYQYLPEKLLVATGAVVLFLGFDDIRGIRVELQSIRAAVEELQEMQAVVDLQDIVKSGIAPMNKP